MTPPARVARVLVVDDQTLFRTGLTSLLAADERVEVVGQAVDRGPESLHPLLYGGVPDGRVHVGEAEPHVGREVRDELVGVHAVDVGEDRGYVTAHGSLLCRGGL